MLADWTTASGTSASPVFVPSSDDYLDTSNYADIVFYLEVSSVTGGAAVDFQYQTAPFDDEAMWVTMATDQFTSAGSALTKVVYASAAVPLAALVRYRVTSTAAAWSVAFRLSACLKNS